MTGKTMARPAALAVLTCGVAAGLFTLKVPAVAESAASTSASAPIALSFPTKPPKGAVVLYSGKADDLRNNWYQRYTKNPSQWAVGKDGAATPNRVDITSRQEFGDHFLHVEFRTPVDERGNPRGGGNAGVGLQGRYEIQILSDYGRQPESHASGSLYSQKPARVNASKKAGEWQTYDILFRAPRFDADGKVTEQARATVFQNGILVQNNEEFRGPTGIQYGEFRGEAKTGPLVLQGDHDPVQYRNIWAVPL